MVARAWKVLIAGFGFFFWIVRVFDERRFGPDLFFLSFSCAGGVHRVVWWHSLSCLRA